ncbi:hypothetical protein H4R18_003565 [Coemansia javaensis]|uniref:Uncharacterized protein n=1 Tax=Coemansia javaensis TaxID=2761396 RepID=A0A9W8LH41_9FUNG|nr:hypothetical protein H4R18_003565 [Coemansia javaensis]
MFSIAVMSPPATPRGPIFSPRQPAPHAWSFRTISLERGDKRQRLEPVEPACRPMSPGPSIRRSMSTRTPPPSSLAARRLRRNGPAALALRSPGLAHALDPLATQSTGLSPVVRGMSLGAPEAQPPQPPPLFRLQKPARPSKLSFGGRQNNAPAPTTQEQQQKQQQQQQQQQQQPKSQPAPPVFRLQKPAPPSKLSFGGRRRATEPISPPEDAGPRLAPSPAQFRLLKPTPTKAAREKPSRVPRLNIEPTGLISPPDEPAARDRRPPPLSLAGALADPGMSPSSPCMPLTPGASRNPTIGLDQALFGEASPSLYDRPTPPPIAGAPVFVFTPPSPPVVAPLPGAAAAADSGSPPPGAAAAAATPAASLAPCTPPWPKTGASLRRTIFDHIGKPQLSPMDLRGYMAISMS